MLAARLNFVFNKLVPALKDMFHTKKHVNSVQVAIVDGDWHFRYVHLGKQYMLRAKLREPYENLFSDCVLYSLKPVYFATRLDNDEVDLDFFINHIRASKCKGPAQLPVAVQEFCLTKDNSLRQVKVDELLECSDNTSQVWGQWLALNMLKNVPNLSKWNFLRNHHRTLFGDDSSAFDAHGILRDGLPSAVHFNTDGVLGNDIEVFNDINCYSGVETFMTSYDVWQKLTKSQRSGLLSAFPFLTTLSFVHNDYMYESNFFFKNESVPLRVGLSIQHEDDFGFDFTYNSVGQFFTGRSFVADLKKGHAQYSVRFHFGSVYITYKTSKVYLKKWLAHKSSVEYYTSKPHSKVVVDELPSAYEAVQMAISLGSTPEKVPF